MQVPSTDGVILELHDLGGSGPPLLLCHCTGFLARAYEPMAAWLAPHRHVWAVDFRGHGASTPPPGDDFNWRGVGEDVLAVIDHLAAERGGGPIDAFGHSMGGAALLLAELRRPGTLRSAYLYEPIVMPTVSSPQEAAAFGNPMAEGARRRRAEFASKAEALYRYASRPPLGAFNAMALARYVEHGFAEQPDGTARLRLSPELEARCFEGDDKPTVAGVAPVTTPTTIAAGAAETGWGPATFAPLIADALGDGHLVTFEHLGHFGPLQDPIGVAADVVDWLTRRTSP